MNLVSAVIKERICYVEMQNADHFNCLSEEMCQELIESLQYGYDQECVGIVIKAQCKKGVWSAGHDIRELPQDGNDPLAYDVPMEKLIRKVQETPIPVIACVDGTVWGGACDLCLSCDMIVSSSIATFAITPAKRELLIGEKDDPDMEDGVPMDYDPLIFGKKPRLTYDLDEYRQFYTIREVLIEYVRRVRHNKINGVDQLVLFSEDMGYESWPAMVFIDGMPVIDIVRLLNYDARRIRYINIYEHYTFGNGVYKGILSFVSRSGRLTNYPTEPNTQYVVYEFP